MAQDTPATGNDPLSDWLNQGGTVILKPGADKKDSKWSQVDPFGYNQAKQFLQDQLDIPSATAGAFVNDQAAQWFQSHSGFPQAWQLLNDPTFVGAASKLPTGAALLPGAFRIDNQVFVNTPETGPFPVPGLDPETLFLLKSQDFAALGISPDFIQNKLKGGLPNFSQDEIVSLFEANAPKARGGRGGGGGSRAPVYDRATITESVRGLWKYLLKEDPQNLDALVSDYVKDATAFNRKGGQLGLDAWVRGKIRESPRYNVLYDKKPEFVDEDKWLAGFEQISQQQGLRPASVLRQVESGASQGQSLAGFQKRISNTPEARAVSGTFSKGFAQTVAGLGALARG